METRRQLVVGVLEGSREAFLEFYEIYFPRIYRFCERRSQSPAEAEVLCEQIFETVVTHLAEVGAEQDLDVWVLRHARRQASCRSSEARTPELEALSVSNV